jgi:hypothetical protein
VVCGLWPGPMPFGFDHVVVKPGGVPGQPTNRNQANQPQPG